MARPKKNENLDPVTLKQKPVVKPHEDPFIAMGDNAAAYLRDSVETLEKYDAEIAAIRALKKKVKVQLKKDGFEARALDVIIKKRAQDSDSRLLFEDQVAKMEKVLGMQTLFDYAERTNRENEVSETEEDADQEAVA